MEIKNPWENIELKEELKTPEKIVRELFSPLEKKSNNKVTFELHQVNFFPEEVVIQFDEPVVQNYLKSKELPHPDFGYEPEFSGENQFIRIRLLLMPTNNKKIKYEFFKFKYPLMLYPTHIFLNEYLIRFFKEFDISEEKKFIIINHENDLYSFIYKIINLDSTIQLIKRLMIL